MNARQTAIEHGDTIYARFGNNVVTVNQRRGWRGYLYIHRPGGGKETLVLTESVISMFDDLEWHNTREAQS